MHEVCLSELLSVKAQGGWVCACACVKVGRGKGGRCGAWEEPVVHAHNLW